MQLQKQWRQLSELNTIQARKMTMYNIKDYSFYF